MSILVLIPARMASTRLPGKPLAEIHGDRPPVMLHPDDARARHPGDLADDRADRARGPRDDHRVARPRLGDLEGAEIRRPTGHSEHP